LSFLFQSLLAIGIPLIGVPLLIHLINLRRHRRVEWAAMEFLLESQKRNKKWIVLKQLLLLLLRTAAVALVVFMLAGPVIRSGWAGLFGRGVTHHLILLDDSYSMSDRWDETSAIDEAKRAVSRILDQAREQTDNQIVTILRFSEARRLAAGAGPEIDRRPLDAQFQSELEQILGQLSASESDAGPVEAIQAATRLPEPTIDETRIAYLVTDFRRPQWEERAQLRQLIGRLRERVAKLLFVQSVYDERPNLAITRLAPEAGIRAAGVETWIELTVANYSKAPASAVTVAIEQDGARLPAVEIDEIAAGEEATRRFRVTFPDAGAHQLTASLEGDAVETDNVRYFAADIPAAFPVLVIDASAEGDDGRYLSTALDPGGRKAGGWVPQIEPASFLRRHEELANYAVICLLDVPRLDEAEVAALEAYVRAGGGLAVFLGGQTQRSFYNEQLYRDGEGLLPAPLGVPSQLLRDSRDPTADVQVTDHPVFRVFAGQRNSFLAVAKVNFYYALDPAWSPPERGDVNVIARLRNGAPLSIEKKLGAGRVVVHLCKLSPQPADLGVWSNWSVNPVFPVFANELVGYLSASRRRFDAHGVDEPVRISLAEAEYQPEVRVRPPGAAESAAATIVPAAKDGQYVIDAPGAPRSGVWEFELKTRDGKPETRYAAVNVAPGEGELNILEEAELAERLRGIDYQYSLASEFSESADELAGFRLGDALLYTLAGVLIIEQLFAVSASYHPGAQRRTA
jgi:hypothetical protein